MKKILTLFCATLFVTLVLYSSNAKAEPIRRSWSELQGHWSCIEYDAPNYDPGWRCANGDKPDCWRTVCYDNDNVGHSTTGYGCSCI